MTFVLHFPICAVFHFYFARATACSFYLHFSDVQLCILLQFFLLWIDSLQFMWLYFPFHCIYFFRNGSILLRLDLCFKHLLTSEIFYFAVI